MKSTSDIGTFGELTACAWLIQEGYAVFRNVAPSGPVDIVAVKDGAVHFFDVKTWKSYGLGILLNQSAHDLGVKVILVDQDTGACSIVDPLPAALDTVKCPHCKTEFTPRRRNTEFCSKRCGRGYRAGYDPARSPGRQKGYRPSQGENTPTD